MTKRSEQTQRRLIDNAAKSMRELGWHELSERMETERLDDVLALVKERQRPGYGGGYPYERQDLEGCLRESMVIF